MCGRFTLTAEDLASLAREWAAEVEEAVAAGWRPRFNVAPGDRHPVLVAQGGRRRLISAGFGWRAPGGVAAPGGLLINARAETAASLPTFREAFRARRAAVPADGFYEWEGPASARRPTWFHTGGPMLLAALLGEAPAGGPGFVILTTDAREPVRALHDRMPLLLPPALLDAWLQGPPPALPAPVDGALQARPVSPRVNAVEHDDPACLAPPPPPAQGRLF
jgi:putative SOS response-associated peptidase YedK